MDHQAIGPSIPSSVLINRDISLDFLDETAIPVALDSNFDPEFDKLLYVYPEDTISLLRWCETHALAIASDDDLPLQDRALFFHRCLHLEATRLFDHRARFGHILELLKTIHVATRFFLDNPGSFPLALASSASDPDAVHRAVSGGLLAAALIAQADDGARAARALLAGIAADIGVVDSHRRLMEQDRALTPPERNIIKAHPVSSARLLSRIGFEDQTVVDAVIYHHERIDGSGYPSGLPGHDIPRLARYVGIANEFVSLTSPRGSIPAASNEDAIQQLARQPFDDSLIDLVRVVVQHDQVSAA